jgi:hypothetical protein
VWQEAYKGSRLTGVKRTFTRNLCRNFNQKPVFKASDRQLRQAVKRIVSDQSLFPRFVLARTPQRFTGLIDLPLAIP